MSAVLEALPWPVVVATADGRVDYSNAAYADAFGRSLDTQAGETLRAVDAPWNCVEVQDAVGPTNGERVARDIAVPRERALRVRVAPLARGDHRGDGWMVCIDDCRAHGRLQAEVRDLNERLEAALARRTAQVDAQAESLRALTAELLQAEDRERERLAETLHDHLQQVLVAAQMRLHLLDKAATPQQTAAMGAEVRGLLQQAIDQTRSLAMELGPPTPPGGGVSAAMRSLAQHFRQHYGLAVTTRVEEAPAEVPEGVRAFVLRAARELLFNVVKHAGVNEATLTLRGGAGDVLTLTVRDAGRGCKPLDVGDGPTAGYGLGAMRHRAGALGGRLELRSPPDGGCLVVLELPSTPREAP